MSGQRFLVSLLLIIVIAGVTGAAMIQLENSQPRDGSSDAVVVDRSNQDFSGFEAHNYVELYQETSDSVIAIVARGGNSEASGSGFMYRGDGYIVTNQHVVEGFDDIQVWFNRDDWRDAEVVGEDRYTDLAVIKVENPPSYASPLPVSRNTPKRGEPAIAIGNPYGLENSVTAGIVSGVNRTMVAPDDFTIPDVVQTDTAINPGNSGGPLISVDGSVIGVVRAIQGENIGFAISPALVNKVVPELIKNGDIDHPYMGVSTLGVSPSVADVLGMDEPRGILVDTVLDGSPSDGVIQGGDRQESVNGFNVTVGGDIILGVDGKSINSNEELSSYLMREKHPGDEIEVRLIRDGEEITVTVELGVRP